MTPRATTWLPQKTVKPSKSKAVVYKLKITLMGSEPTIWRRVLVSGNVSLGRLDRIIQVAMGWTNSHMHVFMVGKRHFGRPHPEPHTGGCQPFPERNEADPDAFNRFFPLVAYCDYGSTG